MSDVSTTGTKRERRGAPPEQGSDPRAPRIRIEVPLGTPFQEIQEYVYRQAWQLAGTQLKAAVSLGITPETISRFLKRCERDRLDYPGAQTRWGKGCPKGAPLEAALTPAPEGSEDSTLVSPGKWGGE